MRDLVAVDGVDSSEIILIDSNGCPTDPTLMSTVSKTVQNQKTLEATFEAFKFPTSNIVQFRAVIPPACSPASPSLATSPPPPAPGRRSTPGASGEGAAGR